MPQNEQVPPEAVRLYQQGQAFLDARPVQAAAAVRCWEQAAELCRQAGARTTQAALLNDIGFVYDSQGDLSRALDYYQRALAIDEAISAQSSDTARDLNNIGFVYQSQGDLPRALDYYQRALAIIEAIAPQSIETAGCLNNVGRVYHSQGNLSWALAYYERALAIDEAIAPQSSEVARDLNNIGLAYDSQGDLSRALSCYQRALAIDQVIAPRSAETARDLNNIGVVYYAQGNLSRAMDYYQRALAIMEVIALHSSGTAACLNSVAHVYHSQGDLSRALDYFQRALAIDEAIAPQSSETARELNNIGGVYRSQGDLSRSLDYFQRALAIDEAIAPQSSETARELNNIGGVRYSQGDLSRALDYFQRALAIDQAIAPQSSETARDLNNIAGVYYSQGDPSRAMDYFQRALAIDEAIAPQSPDTARDLNNIGFVYDSQGDLDRALEAFERSIEIVESLRGRAASGQRGKAGVFAQHIDKYEAVIDILGRMADPARGFAYAERSRARGMAELLAERAIDASAQAPPELLEQERQLKQRLAANYHTLLDASDGPDRDERQIARLAAEQDRIERELEALEARLRQACPEYADLQYPQPLSLEEVQQQVLGADDVLLEYFVGERNSYLWAVRRDRFEFHVLDLTSAELDEQVRGRFRWRLDYDQAVGDDPEYQRAQIEAAKWLYEKLFQPAKPMLEGAARLVLSPDGPLHYLPFEALICGQRATDNGSPFDGQLFLGERYLISYVPSPTVLKNLRDSVARRGAWAANDLIAFGDPDFEAVLPAADQPGRLLEIHREYADRRGLSLARIPATGEEVRKIFALLSGEDGEHGSCVLQSPRARAYLRDQASERRAMAESAGCRYVHFATHGLLDDENPLYSGIAFSMTAAARDGEGDWLLQTYEIFSMKLNADLIVLSACQTGLGKLTKGEGLVGMTRAFMYAGTPSVLVSLWSVADEATALFMVDFYGRIRSGQDKATALIETKRMMMNHPQHPEYRDPFYWAPFVLQGEWTNIGG